MTTTEAKPGAIDASTPEGRIARDRAAKAEDAARRAWAKAGSEGEAPPTPNLDAIQDQYEAKQRGEVPAGKASPGREKQTVVFVVDGCTRVLKNRTYTLGYMAQELFGGAGATEKLRRALKKQGVTDPEHSTWKAEVEGRKVGAVTPAQAEKMPTRGEGRKAAKPAKKPAKKATAKKATPRKRTAA